MEAVAGGTAVVLFEYSRPKEDTAKEVRKSATADFRPPLARCPAMSCGRKH